MKNDAISKRNTTSVIYFVSLLILAFFGGFSFLGTRGAWLLALGILVTIKQFFARQIRLSLPFIGTAMFATLLFVFHTLYDSFEFAHLVAYAIVPVTMFTLGRESSDSKSEFVAIIVALAFGHVAFVMGNLIYSLRLGVEINPSYGISSYYNFWTQKIEARTLISIDTTIVASLGITLMVFPGCGRKWPLRILGGLLLLSYLASSVVFGVRSPIVVAPAALVAVAIHALIKEADRKRKLVGFLALGGATLLFGLFWAFIANNFLGLKDSLAKIPGFNRFFSEGGIDNARMHHYEVFLEHWLQYPWGGMHRAGLLGIDGYGGPMYFHNGFLQVYTHGGFPLSVLAVILLVFLFCQITLVRRTPENGVCLTLAISIIAAIFAIFMIEPMITSAPFISSCLFFAGGYLTGQLTKQKQKKPFFVFGLNDWEEPASFAKGTLVKLILFVAFGVFGGILVSFTSGGPFYAIFALAFFVLTFLLIDKTQYNLVSWIKTAISFAFTTGIISLEFYLLPNPSLLFSIIKVMIGFFAYLLVRVIIIQKRDPEDGYRALRNLFIRISQDASLSEENLVN